MCVCVHVRVCVTVCGCLCKCVYVHQCHEVIGLDLRSPTRMILRVTWESIFSSKNSYFFKNSLFLVESFGGCDEEFESIICNIIKKVTCHSTWPALNSSEFKIYLNV